MSFQQFNINNVLTSVNAASTTTLIGTYFNGPLNNGVGATFTFPTGPFVVDFVVIEAGMSVLLKDQTNPNENGIYFCNQTGNSLKPAILERRKDLQSIEQISPGQFFSASDGKDNAGAIFCLIDPLPQHLGIDPLTFVDAISKNIDINLDTATPGRATAFNVSLSDSVAINDGGADFTAIRGGIYPNGIIQDSQANGVQGVIQAQGGTFAPSADHISSVSAILDFTRSGTTINGAQIHGFFVNYLGTSNPANLSNVNMFKSFNDTLQSVGCHYYMWGPANYAFSLQGVTGNYYLMTGTSVGSPGDPAHCNAPRAIKILANNIEVGYIPVFLSNS